MHLNLHILCHSYIITGKHTDDQMLLLWRIPTLSAYFRPGKLRKYRRCRIVVLSLKMQRVICASSKIMQYRNHQNEIKIWSNGPTLLVFFQLWTLFCQRKSNIKLAQLNDDVIFWFDIVIYHASNIPYYLWMHWVICYTTQESVQCRFKFRTSQVYVLGRRPVIYFKKNIYF